MSGYEEVARISAVVEANLAPFEAALAAGEVRGAKFAKVTESSMEKAERSVKEFSSKSAAEIARSGTAAEAAAGRYVDASGRMREANGRFVTGASRGTSQVLSHHQRLGSSFDGVTRKASGFARAMAGGFGLAGGLGFAGALAGVIRTSANFEHQMSRVRAVSGATQSQFDTLRGAAIKLGADSVFTSTEAAQGMEILGASGMQTGQILKAMPGLLDGAAASGEDFASTAEILTSTLGAFNMNAGKSSHIMDVLASASLASQASIGDVGESLKYTAPVAKAFGMSIEQTAAVLTQFASAGIKGSQGGTSLRASLLQLSDGRGASAKALKQVGVDIEGANGKIKPFAVIVGELGQKFQTMSQKQRLAAASAIFGQEAAAGMLKVIGDGPAKLDKLTAAFVKSDGAAHKMATQMTDNLWGDVQQFMGALEKAAIQVGEAFEPVMRAKVAQFQVYVNSDEFVADAKEVVGAVVAIGSAMADTAAFVYKHRDAIVALGAAYVGLKVVSTGALLLGGGGAVGAARGGAGLVGMAEGAGAAAVGAAPKLLTFAKVAGTAARGLTAIGLGTIAAQALWSIAHSGHGAALSAEEAAGRIATLQSDIDKMPVRKVTTVVVKTSHVDGDGKPKPKPDPTKGIGTGVDLSNPGNADTVRNVVSANAAAEKAYQKAIEARASAQERAHYAAGNVLKLSAQRQQTFNDLVKAGVSEVDALNHPSVKGLDKLLNNATKEAGDAADALKGTNKEVKKTESNADAAGRAMASAMRKIAGVGGGNKPAAVEAFVDGMSDAQRIAKFGTVNVNKALSMMGYVKVNGRWYDSLTQQAALGKAVAKEVKSSANSILQGVGDTFTSSAYLGSMRLSKAQALALARQTKAEANTILSSIGSTVGGGGGTHRAGGGKVSGEGTSTSDSIPAWLSDGEYVIKASSVSKYGEGFLDAVNRGALPKFAGGGRVSKEAREAADARHQKASDHWSGLTDAQSLAELTIDKRLAIAERTGPGSKAGGKGGHKDDIAALQALARQQDAARASYVDFTMGRGSKKNPHANEIKVGKKWVSMYSLLSAGEKAGVQQAIAAALRGGADARQRIKDFGGVAAGSPEAQANALQTLQDRYSGALAGLDVEMATAEGTANDFTDDKGVLTRIAATYGSEADDLRKLIPTLSGKDLETANSALAGAIRGQQDATKRAEEGLGQSDDASALADQAKRQSEIDANRARIAESALGVFTGAGDIGYGGGAYAFGSAAGMRPAGITVNVNALSGYDPAVKSAIAGAANGGFSQGGMADASYSGRS